MEKYVKTIKSLWNFTTSPSLAHVENKEFSSNWRGYINLNLILTLAHDLNQSLNGLKSQNSSICCLIQISANWVNYAALTTKHN